MTFDISIRQLFLRNLDLALEFLILRAQNELKAQGHVLTGRTIASFEKQIRGAIETKLTGEILQDEHAMILDAGVVPGRVPYSPGSGAKSSKYIDALIRYVQLRSGSSLKEAKSGAFAIAATAKKEGHPTAGSFIYSQNGRRTGWIKHAYSDKALVEFERRLAFDSLIQGQINIMVGNINRA